KHIIEQDADRLAYLVDADPESKTASALDILRKVPLLSTDADDNLQLQGSDNFRILINGKSSSFFLRNQSDLLRILSASSIQTIEVMSVPPLRYEAQGVGGIINIITYKKSLGGYSGGVNLRASKPEGFYTNNNLSITMGKISFSGNVGYSTTTSPINSSSFYRQDKARQSSMEQAGSSRNTSENQNVGGEMNYQLNSYNLITAGYSFSKGRSNNRYDQEVLLFDAGGVPAGVFHRFNKGSGTQQDYEYNVDYQRSFKNNEAQQLTLSYKFSNSTNGMFTDLMLQPLLNFSRRASATNNDDNFREENIQAHYVQPIKKHTLELGGHAILRKNTSDYFYENQDTVTGAFILDTTQSNIFHYKESIYALYTSFNLKTGKWGAKFGSRMEQAVIDAHFVSSGTFARQTYVNVIPTVTLSRQFKGVSLIKLSYTQRIHRPALEYLNPYIDITDPWNISYGNPGLQPSLAHVFQLAYNTSIKRTFVNLSFFHQFTTNSILKYTVLGTDTIARSTFGNIGKNSNSNLSLSINTTFLKNVNLNLNSAANYVQFVRMAENKLYTNEGLTYNVSGAVGFRAKRWRISSNAGYNAPNILLQGKSAGYFSHSITIAKHFYKNQKATISLLVSSPFQERRHSFIETNDPTFYSVRESYTIVRRYNLSFNYRFGKVHGGTQKK
ncbi:MAG: TonB-dependent receptor, partial [Bacteroidota bacterium]|nr:TonB-dependent receptor [Bacteroidota bacterium]